MKMSRSEQDQVIAGVCGGLAENLGWSPSKLRVVWILASLFTAFAGVLLYFALWYLMPKGSPAFDPPLMQPWKPAG